MIGLFLVGCGSADPSFGATLSLELDAGVDARAVMGAGGRGAGGATGSGGFDTACGPDVKCNGVGPSFSLACVADSDCCNNMRCLAGHCAPPDTCESDDDCPCGMYCRPQDGSAQPCGFYRAP